MAIIFTGTTITAVKHTTTDIDTVVHTGTTVFTSAPLNHIWVLIGIYSSEPEFTVGFIESSSATSEWLNELNATWPPNNYAIGETACVWDGNSEYYSYQVQGE